MLLEGEGLEPGEQAEVQAWAAALEEDSAALQARQSSHLEASCSEGRSRAEKLTSLTIEALRSTVNAFFHAMPKACANCEAEVPDLKRSACSHTVSSVGVLKAKPCLARSQPAPGRLLPPWLPTIVMLPLRQRLPCCGMTIHKGYLPQANITGADNMLPEALPLQGWLPEDLSEAVGCQEGPEEPLQGHRSQKRPDSHLK